MRRLKSELEAHRGALRACRMCGHADAIAPIVSLARSPKIMLVGQAPGRVESAGGAPFSGRAGRTLFAWFASVGLDEATIRDRIYISAITRCYPGPSPSGRGDRVPSPAERERCAQWLGAELGIIAPRVIIPVGRLAIDAFLGHRPLDALVGRGHRIGADASNDVTSVIGSVRGTPLVIPLPHPSGASSWVHEGGHRRLLASALQLIADEWERAYPRARVA